MAQHADERGSGGSSPVGRGGAGAYIEGELGAFYLLSMLAGSEARGIPGAHIERVRFQAIEEGFALDDLVILGTSAAGATLLEVQSKRTITFSPKDVAFADVCNQIGHVAPVPGVADDRHLLAVATQRTSHKISGPYQDALVWARSVETSAAFFKRFATAGVASSAMTTFVAAFRDNLVAAGVPDNDDVIWQILRRFQILEFDFESSAPLARTFALHVSKTVLSDEDAARAEGLWSALIEIALAAAKVGGSLDRDGLRVKLVDRGFRFAGDRNFAQARAKVAEMARHALADIGNTVAGAHLPRLGVIGAVDEARDGHRVVDIRGGPGVGKSAVLRHAAERVLRESRVIVLDPISTPEGGWTSLALLLGLQGTAREFLADLAATGGAVLFIDSLEMFSEPGRRRTVNDLLREVSAIDGFTVIMTARSDFGQDGKNWLADDAIAALGPSAQVAVSELDDAEVTTLSNHLPELRVLLLPGHPAARIARNLYRLSRLLKVPDAAAIRTEAALAAHWWTTADGVADTDVHAAQRILSDLADAALAGHASVSSREDSGARTRLLGSLTLRELQRDRLVFYHDVLRDWAVGMRLCEQPDLIDGIDLSPPVPAAIARGIEFAGRLALERQSDGDTWLALLARLSPAHAHGSWRRHVLMAILRSELASNLLKRNSSLLLANGGALLAELCAAIAAVDTVRTIDVVTTAAHPAGEALPTISPSLRTAVTAGARRLLAWCVAHAADIPLQALGAVIKLTEIQLPLAMWAPSLARPVARMLYSWLLQLDCRKTDVTIRSDPEVAPLERSTQGRMVEELRRTCLLLTAESGEDAKAYLRAISAERDPYKIKAIRPFSQLLAGTVPEELAALIESDLIEPAERGRSGRQRRDRAFSHSDSDYIPPSPAQPPFLDLLHASPETGLKLIHRLLDHAVDYHAGRAASAANGFTLVFKAGPRVFPWMHTYLWSRDQAHEYSVTSALMALEAWGHARLDAGEAVDAVIADTLGPDGSCAAYLLVAVDLLISHWPASREALVPFISCPELLAIERGRGGRDQMGHQGGTLQAEPSGRVRLEHLRARPSRRIPLESVLFSYSENDEISKRARSLLQRAVTAIGPYGESADFGDPAFMGAYALNILDPSNWVSVDGAKTYCSPASETEHLARLEAQRTGLIRSSETRAKIDLAISDRARGSSEIAEEAVAYAAGDLPDDTDSDYLRSRSTRLIATAMLVARDGDDALLSEHAAWVREVVARGLAEGDGRFSAQSDMLDYNRPALAACALIHLWVRQRQQVDRDALVKIATRDDHCGHLAFAAALREIIATDARVVKSAVRAAFAACRWHRQSWDGDEAETGSYAREKAAADEHAVAAEVEWLNGGSEPAWPSFPEERPIVRRALRIPLSEASPSDLAVHDAEQQVGMLSSRVDIHTDSRAAAAWLRMAASADAPEIDWLDEVVDAYADWSARANGFGLPVDTELERMPMEWNNLFYALVASAIMNGSEEQFEHLLQLIERLPDRPFSDVTEALLHAADVVYFNDSSRPADKAVRLRDRIGQRTIALRMWNRDPRPGDLSIDHETGAHVATFFMNTYNLFSGTRSYLVPAVFDRIDPLLRALRPLLGGGPTAFIALCTMNTLMVAPRARHAEFLLAAVEAWFVRLPTDAAMWIELNIGRRVVEWLEAVMVEEPALRRRDHPLRARLDTMIGRLVGLGVPEAHELERRIAQEPTA